MRRMIGAMVVVTSALVLFQPNSAVSATGPILRLGAIPAPVEAVGTFSLSLLIDPSVAPDASIVIDIPREPLADRVAYRQSIGRVPKSKARQRAFGPIGELVAGPDGLFQFDIPITDNPSSPDVTLREPGVYAVSATLLAADDTELAQIRTHLIRLPTDPTEMLRLAFVMPIGQTPTVEASGRLTVTGSQRRSIIDRSAVLAARPSLPVTIAPAPAMLEAIEAAGNNSVVADLRDAIGGRPILTVPYVGLDARSMGPGELSEQLRLGSKVLANLLGDAGDSRTWFVGATTSDANSVTGLPAIDSALLESLSGVRVNRIIVPDGSLAPFDSEPVPDVARPFEVDSPQGSIFQSVAIDRFLVNRLEAPESALVTADDLLGELAVIWLEQSDSARGLVLAPPDDWKIDQTTMGALLDFVRESPFIKMVGLDAFFTEVAPVSGPSSDGGDEPVIRTLNQLDPAVDESGYVSEVGQHRLALASLNGMMTDEAPDMAAARRALLAASAVTLDPPGRRELLDEVKGLIGRYQNSVSALDAPRTSILSRQTDLKLQVLRTGTRPLRVQLRLSSDKLTFAEPTRIITLNSPLTTVIVPVVARSSGNLVMRVEFRTPDGLMQVGPPSRVQVRSFAVSGLGLVLSIGALTFLGWWWWTDWRRRRRVARTAGAESRGSESAA